MNASMFTDEEIKEQLKSLGFSNIPRDKFEMFKKDLVKLILNESAASQTSTSIQNDEIYTKAGLSKRRVTFPDEDSTASVMSNEDDYEEVAESSFVSITTTSSIVDNKLMKRKIARKVPIPVHHENKPQPSMDKLNNDLKNMHLKQVNSEAYSSATSFSTANDQIRVGPKQQLNHQYEEEEEEEENTTTNDRSQVTIENQYYSDDENYFRLNDHYLPINYPVKSFIRSQSSLSIRSDASSMRGNANKSDPLRLYEKYRKTWTKQKAPGEKNHKDLRWSVREQMLEKHVVVKKPKVYVPNSYVIPTEKKRQQLRWVVRSALANPVS